MKNFLLALLLLAPLAASAENECEQLAGLAKKIAETRDNGHSLKTVLSVLTKEDDDTDKLIRNTVRAVYSSRLLPPEEIEEIYLAKCNE